MSKQAFVLVIEDAKELATIFAEILEMNGIRVEVISDGAVALQRLETVVPDLLLLDMHLPHVSGLEILDFVKTTSRLNMTKVVAITANTMLTDELEGKADLLLIKPVRYSQINELVMRLLGSQEV